MKKDKLVALVEKYRTVANEYASKLWENPETSENEKNSSQLLREILKENGFRVHDITDMQNSFYADFGNGGPIIGLLAEYDALPGLSQKLQAVQEAIVENAPGHGCGHNLLGAGILQAALGLKEYIETVGIKGTVRLYACPEEETLVGKTKMVNAGVFSDCDIALSWHPFTSNIVYNGSFLANNSIKFRFKGVSAHAGASPHLGRSALDAVELMNVGANYLREHVIDSARIHYTITNAGGPPNVVPKEAESWYFVRAPKRKDVQDITKRLFDIAKGAALMTGTTMEMELLGGVYEMLPNDELYNLTQANLLDLGHCEFDKEAFALAKKLQDTIAPEQVESEAHTMGIMDYQEGMYLHEGIVPENIAKHCKLSGSTDVGSVSWNIPTNFFATACWPIGVAAHSWQAVVASGSSIGTDGMNLAAKVIAGVAYDLYNDEEKIKAAKADFEKRTKTIKYVSPI